MSWCTHLGRRCPALLSDAPDEHGAGRGRGEAFTRNSPRLPVHGGTPMLYECKPRKTIGIEGQRDGQMTTRPPWEHSEWEDDIKQSSHATILSIMPPMRARAITCLSGPVLSVHGLPSFLTLIRRKHGTRARVTHSRMARRASRILHPVLLAHRVPSLSVAGDKRARQRPS